MTLESKVQYNIFWRPKILFGVIGLKACVVMAKFAKNIAPIEKSHQLLVTVVNACVTLIRMIRPCCQHWKKNLEHNSGLLGYPGRNCALIYVFDLMLKILHCQQRDVALLLLLKLNIININPRNHNNSAVFLLIVIKTVLICPSLGALFLHSRVC